jgi:V/A-type H+-transporting ATPase subunit B
MVGDDITHPIPDLTGYITEGQIALSRELHRKNVYPPIDVLPSLSRLMNLGVGKGKTRDDHKQVSDQMYANYAEGRDLRGLVAIVGEEALSDRDKRLLHFAADFEAKFVKQGRNEDRSIGKTLDLGWQLLARFPKKDLSRISGELKDRYYREDGKAPEAKEEKKETPKEHPKAKETPKEAKTPKAPTKQAKARKK